MTSSFAQTAIALLTDMAERGEIDPWDVEVVTVFDRCLNELAQRNQQDLSHSGQVFLYASMLVLLKSDSLIGTELDDPDLDTMDGFGLEAEAPFNLALPLNLERRLQRRAAAPPPQRRRVTLQELIAHLEVIAATVEPQNHRTRSRTVQRQTKSAAIKSITQLAHQENLVEIATEIDQFLSHQWPYLATQQDWLDLETLLVEFKDDRVGVFWALLFLASQSKVELYQEEFYRELKLRPCSLEEVAAGA